MPNRNKQLGRVINAAKEGEELVEEAPAEAPLEEAAPAEAAEAPGK